MKYVKSFFAESILKAMELCDFKYAKTLIDVYASMFEHELRKGDQGSVQDFSLAHRERDAQFKPGDARRDFVVSYRSELGGAEIGSSSDQEKKLTFYNITDGGAS